MARLNGHARTILAELAPLGRIGRSEEIADAAFFLASDQSAFATGIELVVHGGMTQV